GTAAGMAAGMAAGTGIGVAMDAVPDRTVAQREVDRTVDESEEASYQATAAGTVKGTPAYMAPEQWRGEESSEATDVWALGIVLHELLAGRRPGGGGNAGFLGLALAQAESVPVSAPVLALALAPALGHEVPAETAELVGRCLEKDAARRPSAAQVVDVLERALWEGRRQVGAEQSPFRGLFSFAERHADMFFGRDNEVAGFLESLREQAVLPVVGPSGAGKSSFVQAGVIPRLREQGAWTTLAIRPGADPFGALVARLAAGESMVRKSESVNSALRTSDLFPADRLLGIAEVEAAWTLLAASGDEATLAQKLCARPELLGVMLHDLAARQMCKVLLFVDQLEETYTLVADPSVREAFIRAVCRVADHPSSPVRAVFTIRDDFLGSLGGGPEVAAALARVFVLRRPSKEGLEEVLTRPLVAVGYAYDDPSLPSEMVDSVEGEPACLPLLQFAGQMLWERRDKNQRRLLRATFEAMGGVAGSLAEHADGVLAGMTPAQVELARQLLLRLVTSAGTRKVLSAAAAVAGLGPGIEEVLEKLTQARLLTVRRAADPGRHRPGEGKGGGGGGEAVLELVHESLVRTWRRLARWIEESHEELALLAELGQAAELWEKRGRRDEEVWQGDALADARRKLARLTTRIPEQVAGFLLAGLRKEKRQRRRRRALVAGAMVFLAAVTIWSLLRERETRVQKERAEAERAEAQAQRAEAQREGARAAFGRGDFLEARAKLRGSLETQDSAPGRALWWKLERDPLVWRKDFGTVAYSAAFSPDGRTIAVGTRAGLVHLVDTETQNEKRLRGIEKEIIYVVLSADGAGLAAGTASGEVGLWHLPTGAFRILEGHSGSVWQLVFTPDGRQLFTASVDRTIRRWNVAFGGGGGGSGGVFATLPSPMMGIAISPDGRLLAAAGRDRTVRLLDASSGSEVGALRGHSLGVSSIAFNHDGSTLVSGGGDRTIRIWDVASGNQLALLRGHADTVRKAAFVHQSGLLVSVSYDKTVRLWDVTAQRELAVLAQHSDKVDGL
ncbi:MAG: WD40 repeat domain-containing serine/threonine-protein kinase, partial [Pseudomonadota bacterium]